MADSETSKNSTPLVPAKLLAPFILVTFLFSLWGFANDITNPMVAAFKNILLISNFQSSLVQFAFYGGYCVMAIPAALFIKRFSYKAGILVGLTLYATGCLLFIPSGWMMAFWSFLLAYFIMTCGLSFLETSANPYILSMGDEENSTRRLNFAQAFNPMGSITGMLIASQVILVSLNPTTETGRRQIQEASQGTTLYSQLYTESLGRVAASQDTLQSDKALDADDFKTINDHITAAQSAMSCIELERGTLAVQLEKDLDAAKAKSPKLLGGLFQKIKKDPDVAAAQEAYKAEHEKLKANFEGKRDLLDSTKLAYEEGQLLEAVSPGFQAPTQTHVLAAIESFEQMTSSIAAAGPDDFKLLASELKIQLDLGHKNLQAANALLAAIPAETLASIAAEAGDRLAAIRQSDLNVIIGPYTILGIVVLGVLVVFAIARLPRISGEDDNALNLGPTLARLGKNKKYLEGVVAQAFYVGAQIMCWTFIIQYGVNELGLEKATAQNYTIVAMTVFVSSRFVCTFLLKFFSPGGLLMTLALAGLGLVAGAIFIHGMMGLYCLMAVSACMSLMFPTIYGIALKGLGDDAKLGAAGLIMAIGGGCLMPPMQAAIMDMNAFNLGFMTLSSTRASFVLPLICFIVIAIFGLRTSKVHGHTY
jgi:fucose permease